MITITHKSLLKEAREECHKAVQLVGMVPRCLLPPDSTDSSASLIWHHELELLSSQSVEGLFVGFSFIDQQIQVIRNSHIVKRIDTVGSSFEQVFETLKNTLTEEGLEGSSLKMDLPYELPESVTNLGGPFRKQDDKALGILTSLYKINNEVLEEIFGSMSEASDIRCWPHHFDLATLVTIEPHDDPEKAKSIGFGLSPGDDGYDEPYFYLTPWPYPDEEKLYEIQLPAFWSTDGWVGGVLKAADIPPGQEKEVINNYFTEGYKKLKSIL